MNNQIYPECRWKACRLLSSLFPNAPFAPLSKSKNINDIWRQYCNIIKDSVSTSVIEAILPLLGALLLEVIEGSFFL